MVVCDLTDKCRPSEILEGLRDYWGERSRTYSIQNVAEMNDSRKDRWADLILSMAPKKQALRILDVGTGPGFFAMILALRGHEVTAVDVTDEMLAHARENADAYGADIRFVKYSGEVLPFADGSFDLIVSRNVIWNLEGPKQALCDWMRVLKPGGRMVYFDANWYLYLYDEALFKKQRSFKKKPDANDMSKKRTLDLEEIAYSLPMSKCVRPEWDRAYLTKIGMEVHVIDENISTRVQNDLERYNESMSPIFMVCAEKPRANG